MERFDAGGVTGVVWRRVAPEHEAAAEAVMREIMGLCRSYVGYQGSEIFPPIAGVQDAYVVLYRFDSSENLQKWLKSDERARLRERFEPYLVEPAHEFCFSHRRRASGTISTVFSYRIRPGFEDRFHEWRQRIFEAARVREGFVGIESFDAFDSGLREFIVVLRFDGRAHLDQWLNSPERAAFLKEVEAYVDDFQVRRTGTGFEGWFEYGKASQAPAPWRQGLVILAALFPVIMTLRVLLAPLFAVLPYPLAFFVLLTVDVTILTYLIMPHFTRFMNFWLRPKPGSGWRTELGGWAVLLTLIGVTLAVTIVLDA